MMIVTLTGVVQEKLQSLLVVEAGGIGYGVLVITEDMGGAAVGEKLKLYIHEHIREDAHDLYGFQSRQTLELFEKLLSVNGVGPKMALSLLSIGTPDAVKTAIATGDTKWLQSANGVGKRVAERIIVDLKEKVGLVSSADATSFLGAPAVQDEAVQALVSLGYTPQDAAASLANVPQDLPTEDRIKQALKVGV